SLPESWFKRYELHDRPVPVHRGDPAAFGRWCATAAPVHRPGQLALGGLRPLVKAEIQWGLYAHTQRKHRSTWSLTWVQQLVNVCRERGLDCLDQVDQGECPGHAHMICQEIRAGL